MTQTEFDCRWSWWVAAFDFFKWTNEEGSENVSGFIRGEFYDPIRGW